MNNTVSFLFDGAGLARLGFEQEGFQTIGVELDPIKHYLSSFVCKGYAHNKDVRDFDYAKGQAIWASPPCQQRSSARTQGAPKSIYSDDLLEWSLALPCETLWVENIMSQSESENKWGTKYNAAQFSDLQNRNRIIGGRYPAPKVNHPYAKKIGKLCPAITASEYKGCASDKRRASRYYGRRLTIEECAYHQGFDIPQEWYIKPDWFDGTRGKWYNQLYEAIGNGVPVYMSRAFARAYKESLNANSLDRV